MGEKRDFHEPEGGKEYKSDDSIFDVSQWRIDVEALITAGNADIAAIEVLLTTGNANTSAANVLLTSLETKSTAANALLTTGNANTSASNVLLTSLETLITASNVLLTSIETLLTAGNASLVTIANNTGGGVNNDLDLLVRTYEGDAGGKTFILPLDGTSTYDFEYEFDGVRGYHNVNTDLTVTATIAGTYVLKILSGSVLPRIKFNNTGDKLKMIDVQNWGDIAWSSWDSMFYGCSNMTFSATDIPDTTAVINFGSSVRDCALLTTLPNMSMASATFWNHGFRQTGITTVPAFAIPVLNSANFAFNGVTIETESYSNLLISFAATFSTGFVFDGGNSKYNAAGATARATLVSGGCTITDGGPE